MENKRTALEILAIQKWTEGTEIEIFYAGKVRTAKILKNYKGPLKLHIRVYLGSPKILRKWSWNDIIREYSHEMFELQLYEDEQNRY